MTQIDISGLFNPTTEENWLYKEYKKQITMAQQTAVEWLVDSIWKGEPTLHQKVLIEQAKEIERHQILDAYNGGQQIPPFEYAEQYYNEIYNK